MAGVPPKMQAFLDSMHSFATAATAEARETALTTLGNESKALAKEFQDRVKRAQEDEQPEPFTVPAEGPENAQVDLTYFNPKNFNLHNFGIVIPGTLGDHHHFVFCHRFSAWLYCTSEN